MRHLVRAARRCASSASARAAREQCAARRFIGRGRRLSRCISSRARARRRCAARPSSTSVQSCSTTPRRSSNAAGFGGVIDFEPHHAQPSRLGSACHSPGGAVVERLGELGAVTLHDVVVRPPVNTRRPAFASPGVPAFSASRTRAPRLRSCRPRAPLPGNRSAPARRTSRDCFSNQSRSTASSNGGSFDARVDHAQRLEDHALADRRVALVEPQREAFAIQHLVVEPHRRSAYSSSAFGSRPRASLKTCMRLRVHLGIDDDRARVVAAARRADDRRRTARAPSTTKCSSGSRSQAGAAMLRRVRGRAIRRRIRQDVVDICLTSSDERKRRALPRGAQGHSSCQMAYLTPATSDRALHLDEDRIAVEPQVRPGRDVVRRPSSGR